MNKPLPNEFQKSSEERKLYAADSLNNLNKLKLCTRSNQDFLSEAPEEGDHSDELGQGTKIKRRNQPLLTVLIMTLVLAIILSSCVLYMLVQMNSTASEMTQKLERGERRIEELEKLSSVFYFANRTRLSLKGP